jgi:hypothetical protein
MAARESASQKDVLRKTATVLARESHAWSPMIQISIHCF